MRSGTGRSGLASCRRFSVISVIAQALAIHRRTLNRRLSAEGTTFQKVLDQVRCAVAKELLGDSDISIAEIAALLKYADYVSFTRAFKRWTGASPGAWRKAARGGSRD